MTANVLAVTQERPPRPVIKDVAELAGVSVPTVSRVLTGVTRVSDDKRTRVLAAIEELNYRPTAAARALVAGAPQLIAVLAGDTSRYGYAETIRGIEERARSTHRVVTITVVESADPTDVSRTMDLLANQSIAGMLVLKFDPPGVEAMRHIPRGTPVVAISGARERELSQAVLAEAEAAEQVVHHLLELGHRTVHHVRVPHSRREDGRTTGWRRALQRAGAVVPPVINATWDPQSGRHIGLRLASSTEVTALFCGNDEVAIGVMRGLAEQGTRVPEQVSVVGFDDHPLAAMWMPSLTTVRQDFAHLGARALDMLEDVIGGHVSPAYSSTACDVVLRESTAPPPPR